MMTSINNELNKRNISLREDNSLPPENRTVKDVRRVIAAVRAAESSFHDALADANESARKAQAEALELSRELTECRAALRVAENRLREKAVQERLDSLDTISVSDKEEIKQLASS